MSPDCPAIVAEEAGAPGLQAPQATCAAGARSDQLHPMLTAAAVRSRGRDGRDSPPPQGLGEGKWVALARALEPCRTQPPSLFPEPPSSPKGPSLGELEVPREKTPIHLLPHSPPGDHHSTDCLLNGPVNSHSLTVGCLREGPAANQWLSRTTNGHSLTAGRCGRGLVPTNG